MARDITDPQQIRRITLLDRLIKVRTMCTAPILQDLQIAKRECREWVKCKMIKESDKEPPTLSGIPIFWAVKNTATLMDTTSLIGDNLWIFDNLVSTTEPSPELTGNITFA